MSKKPNIQMVGLFTLIGIMLFVGSMLILLGNKIFLNDDDFVVLFFDESIKGLSVGSSVVLRGVEVGKVVKIDLITDEQNLTFKVPVFVKFNSSQLSSEKEGVLRKHIDEEEFFAELVKKGLKGRLISQNLLTGQLLIELVILPDVEPVFRGGNITNTEIPTTLSTLGELSKGLQDLPIKQTFENLNTLLEKSSYFIASLDKLTNNIEGDFSGTAGNLNKTLRDISDAARSMRNFADYIERHPESLLKGKGKY